MSERKKKGAIDLVRSLEKKKELENSGRGFVFLGELLLLLLRFYGRSVGYRFFS
jgi:hypothetical protein